MPTHRNRQSLALVASIVFAATPSTEGGAVEELVGLHSRVNDAAIGVYMERPGVVPVSAYVGHNSAGSPTSEHDTYGIGSTTKMFTATAVLQLAEQGKLSLDDLVTDYISAEIVNGLTGGNAGAVRVRHLLAHTSGIGDYVNIEPHDVFEVYNMSRHAVYTPEQLYNYTMQYSAPAFTLGSLGLTSYDDVTASAYSNTGYVMLGGIIASAAGMDWEDYVEQHILVPTGMTRTGFVGRGSPTVDGHASGKLPGPILAPGSLTDSAGNMYSTPRDLAAFLRSWLNGELFADRQTLYTMLRGQPGALLDGKDPYGYGVQNLTQGPAGVLAGHSGQSFGFQCQLFYHVETDTVYAVVINDSMQDAEQILMDLIDAIKTQGWPEPGASTPTCGEIKDAYRASSCCGNPSAPFQLPHDARRLSGAASLEAETGLLGRVNAALEQALKTGGKSAATKLAKLIDGSTREYL